MTNEQKSMIFQALGAASMCWDPRPAGVFDSTEALKIGERLCEELEESLRVRNSDPAEHR